MSVLMIPKMAIILNIGGYTCVGVGRRDTGTLGHWDRHQTEVMT